MPVLGIAEGQVVSTPEPDSFTEDWLTAWNRHDVDAMLTHFHHDVVFTSPVAAQVMSGLRRSGARQGRPAVMPHMCWSGLSC